MSHLERFARAAAIGGLVLAPAALAQSSEDYLGTITATANTYCPDNTLEANGQILQIQQYQALYVVMGDTYGGDGNTTFALPDLRGRGLVHYGQGANLAYLPWGQPGGAEQKPITLTVGQMPAHTHSTSVTGSGTFQSTLYASTNGPSVSNPKNATFATFPSNVYTTGGDLVGMAATVIGSAPLPTVSVGSTGGGQPIPMARNPYVAIRYCVTVVGIFPPRPD